MTNAGVQQSKKKIGRTTYVVTSQFKKEGGTATDKIRCLLNTSTKVRGSCRKS